MEAKMEQSVADFKERGRQDKESGQNTHFRVFDKRETRFPLDNKLFKKEKQK